MKTLTRTIVLSIVAFIVTSFTIESLSAQSIGGGIFGPPSSIRLSTFANLSTPASGNVRYCTDCATTSPCTGSGSGAFAFRVGSAWNCSDGSSGGGGGGTGTVTSVGVSAPTELSVTGSPVTSSGTIALGWASAAQGRVFAGPCSGSGTPVFRLLCAADIPTIAQSQVTNLTTDLAAKVPTSRTITAGSNLTGGGDLSANRTVALATTITGLDSVSSTAFSGDLTGNVIGNVTGNVSGTSGSTTGNAATATALAANGTNCSAGNYPLGVDASGNVENCTAAPSASGDVVGPASSTTDAIAVYSDTTGKLLKNSTVGVTTGGELKLDPTLNNGIFWGTDTDTKYAWRTSDALSVLVAGGEKKRFEGTLETSFVDTMSHAMAGLVSVNRSYAQETTTLSTSGTTTNTSANLAKAETRILAILWRVTTTIGTATDFSVKVTGGTNFVSVGTATAAQTSLTATSTGILVPANYADQFVLSDTTLTVTTTGTPSAGALRLVVVYEKYIPPSS